MCNRAATGVAMLMAGALLTGCTTVKSKGRGYVGNAPDFAWNNVKEYREAQDTIAYEFALLGGLSNLPPHGQDWRPVVEGGMLYVDVRCERFLDALFWLNRVRETTSSQVQYAGAAASAILALTNAAKDLIGIAPLGFGFADQTVNNIGQGLLYHLDPGDVAQLVARKQSTYRGLIKDVKYTQRSTAMNAVAQYAANCLPVRIEGDVNQAIAKSEFERVDHRKKPDPAPADEPADEPADTPADGPADAPVAEPALPAASETEPVVLEVSSPG